MSSDSSNGRAFDLSEWNARAERDEEVRSIERRLDLIAAEMRANQELLVKKLDQIFTVVQRDHSDVTDLYRRWEKLIDRHLDAEKRLTELEQRPTKRARRK